MSVVNIPQSQGDLAKAVSHDTPQDWPHLLEIVAYFETEGGKGRKGKRRSITINPDEWFGRNGYGAPMNAQQLYAYIDKLRKP